MRESLSKDAIKKARQHFIEEAEADRGDGAWEALQPLLRAQAHQEEVALTLIELVDCGYLPHERSLEVLEAVHQAHRTNELLLGLLADALERARDRDMLNAPPPESELFATVVDNLAPLAMKARGTDHERVLLTGLATAARVMARQRDELAESAHRRLLELEPDVAYRHYNWGLFLKTRDGEAGALSHLHTGSVRGGGTHRAGCLRAAPVRYVATVKWIQ